MKPATAWTLTETQKKLVDENIALARGWVVRYASHLQDHDREELLSELYICLCQAAKNYNPKKYKTKFSTFAYSTMQFGFLKWRQKKQNKLPLDYVADMPDVITTKDSGMDPVLWRTCKKIMVKHNRSRRDILVVFQRFWQGKTLKQIGVENYITRERVRQICNSVLGLWRRNLKEEDYLE